ncbi:MAG: PQQ-binding-like beta-propeller repeat protein [Bryobacteraceae bacterium]
MRIALAALATAAIAADADWPAFRGPNAAGVATTRAPREFNADPEAGPMRNVRWKTAIPGLGHSSPIVYGNKLFIATAVLDKGEAPLKAGLYGSGDSAEDAGDQSWKIYCLDKNTGRVIWERTAHHGAPRFRRHTKATHANTTLATDGTRLVAFFGSEGLFAYDLDGKLLFRKDLGPIDMAPWNDQSLSWGFASSPILFENKIIIQCDRKGDPFVAAFSAEDGSEIWRTSRRPVAINGWATPAVIRAGGRTQVVLNSYPYIASYDFATGKELWRLRSGGDIPVPTPIFSDGLIFVTNAHGDGAPLYAIEPGAAGDLNPGATGMAWFEPRNGAYMQTPVVSGGVLFSCSDRGVLKAYEARTGKLHYQQRLGTGAAGFSASPVIAGGMLYQTSEEGEVFVIAAGPEFKLVGTNRLGDTTLATPAVSDGTLYFRTRHHVIAIR